MTMIDLIFVLLAMVACVIIIRGVMIALVDRMDRKRWEALQTKRPYIRRR